VTETEKASIIPMNFSHQWSTLKWETIPLKWVNIWHTHTMNSRGKEPFHNSIHALEESSPTSLESRMNVTIS